MSNIAIIFAGGSGKRMKSSNLPKQFLEIEGNSIIGHTVNLFEQHPGIDKIYISSLPSYVEFLENDLRKKGVTKLVKVVPGGETGQDSIYNALKAAAEDNDENSIVLIHDGVRPIVTEDVISRNIQDVKTYGSSITVTPCYETAIVSTDGQNVEEVPSRDKMYTAQAPQCFYLKDILSAHEKARTSGGYGNVVDSCNLCRNFGINIHMTEGNRDNIKVTTPDDFYKLKALIEYHKDLKLREKNLNPIIEEDIDVILSQGINFEKLKNTTFLITGASGMIGSYLMYTLVGLNNLANYNIKIIAMVRNSAKLNPYFKNCEEITVIEQDVVNPINLNIPIDYIIHAASPASPKLMAKDPVGTIAANTIGTYNTLQLAQKMNARGYCYISSREIYGQPYEDQEYFQENTYGFVDPLNVRSCYPEGKRAAETMCMSFKEQYGIDVKIARPAHTYGPGMSIYDGRVQADFLNNIMHNQNIVMKSEGTSVRTYTYIRDVISAIFYTMLNTKDLPYSNDVAFNMADENSKVSIRQLAELLVGIYPEKGLKVVMELQQQSKGVAPFTLGTLDSTKLRSLGWKPTVTLEEGFKRTLTYLEIEEQHQKESKGAVKEKKLF